jgi:hypothetical protein
MCGLGTARAQFNPMSQDLNITYSTPTPKEVISSMLLVEGVEERHATILLLVDGVQKLYQADPSLLQFAINQLCDLVNSSAAFVVVCATGTFFEPISQILTCMCEGACLLFLSFYFYL